jgi:hypothetical protein
VEEGVKIQRTYLVELTVGDTVPQYLQEGIWRQVLDAGISDGSAVNTEDQGPVLVSMQQVSGVTPDDAHDLDETRRLLYMAMAASVTKRYELVGTLVNALTHHVDMSSENVLDRLLSLIEDPSRADRLWAMETIVQLTQMLDGYGTT